MIKKYITDLITQSFSLKKQSEHLLDVAKRAVEIAIEQDEAAAMAWIAEQTGEQTKAMIA
jgi:type I restriction enzyme S subunit